MYIYVCIHVYICICTYICIPLNPITPKETLQTPICCTQPIFKQCPFNHYHPKYNFIFLCSPTKNFCQYPTIQNIPPTNCFPKSLTHNTFPLTTVHLKYSFPNLTLPFTQNIPLPNFSHSEKMTTHSFSHKIYQPLSTAVIPTHQNILSLNTSKSIHTNTLKWPSIQLVSMSSCLICIFIDTMLLFYQSIIIPVKLMHRIRILFLLELALRRKCS